MKKTAELEEQIMDLLDNGQSMKVGLSEEDSDYDLNFISSKLAKLSVYQERLSDIQMKLTRISLEVKRVGSQKSSILRLKEREIRSSDEYHNLTREEKTPWLATQLETVREDAEEWKILGQLVSEVKEAIGERAGTMKRLDSDIRLHAKIFEAKVAAGATSPSSYTGNSTEEVEI